MSSPRPDTDYDSLAKKAWGVTSPSKVGGYKPRTKTSGNPDFDNLYDEKGKQYDIDPDLLIAQGRQESGFRPNAKSPAGARGIAQFMSGTAKEFGVNPNDVGSSIDGQARLMRSLIDRTNDVDLALAGYNSGHNASVDRLKRNKERIPETRNYVATIGQEYRTSTAKPTSSLDDIAKKAWAASPYDDIAKQAWGAVEPTATPTVPNIPHEAPHIPTGKKDREALQPVDTTAIDAMMRAPQRGQVQKPVVKVPTQTVQRPTKGKPTQRTAQPERRRDSSLSGITSVPIENIPTENIDNFLSRQALTDAARRQGLGGDAVDAFLASRGGNILQTGTQPYTAEEIASYKDRGVKKIEVSFDKALEDDFRRFATDYTEAKTKDANEQLARQELRTNIDEKNRGTNKQLSFTDPLTWKMAWDELWKGNWSGTITEEDRQSAIDNAVAEQVKNAGSAGERLRLDEEYKNLSNFDKGVAHVGDIYNTIQRAPASFAKTAAWIEDTTGYLREKGIILPWVTTTDIAQGFDWIASKTLGLQPSDIKQAALPTLFADAVEKMYPDDKRTANTMMGKIARGTGSAVPFLLGAMATGGGSVATGLLGAGMQVGEMYETAQKEGLSREKQLLSGALGIPIGASEAWGLKWAKLGELINKGSKGVFLKSFTNWLKETGKDATEEALQEFFQSTASKLTITALKNNGLTFKDVTNAVGDSVEDAAVGGIIGALFGGGVPLAVKAGEKATAPVTKARTDALLKAEPEAKIEPVAEPVQQETPKVKPNPDKPLVPTDLRGISVNEKGETTYAGETKAEIEERRRFERATPNITAQQVQNLAEDKGVDIATVTDKPLAEMSADELRVATRAIEEATAPRKVAPERASVFDEVFGEEVEPKKKIKPTVTTEVTEQPVEKVDPKAEKQALAKLGYTVPVQKGLSAEEKADIVARGVRYQKPRTVREVANDIAVTVGGKVVGSASKANTTPKDIDIRIDGEYDKATTEQSMADLGYEFVGSSVVSPKEAALAKRQQGKSFGQGWSRIQHFKNAKGKKVDIFHSVKEETPEESAALNEKARQRQAELEKEFTRKGDLATAAFQGKLLQNQQPTITKGTTVYSKSGVKGTVESVDGKDLGVAWDNNELEVAPTTVDAVSTEKPKAKSATPKDGDKVRNILGDWIGTIAEVDGDLVVKRGKEVWGDYSPVNYTSVDEPMMMAVGETPIFYSQLERTLEDKMPRRATANHIRGLIKDTKQEERDWLGIDEWLNENPNPTKDEVLEFIRSNNVEVEEVEKGKGETDQDQYGQYPRASEVIKFSQYTLPGGENYRELLLTMPSKKGGNNPYTKVVALNNNLAVAEEERNHYLQTDRNVPADVEARFQSAQSAVRDANAKLNDLQGYKSPHWDEPNVLAHVRFDTRDGGKTLHIAEIQSDWHQAGRKKGYKQALTELPEGQDVKYFADEGKWRLVNETGDGPVVAKSKDDYKTAKANALAYLEDRRNSVPNAPFKKSWQELAMKRMLRYAVENGYERVTWDTGETSAERYDLSKQVNSITVPMVNDDGTRSVRIDPKDGDSFKLMVDERGVVTGNYSASQFSGKSLEDVIGKELAQKVMDASSNTQFTGVDLKVGGEGMKGFYDKILPTFVNKYTKKWGGRVESGTVASGISPMDQEIRTSVDVDGLYTVETGSDSWSDLTEKEADAKVAELKHKQNAVHSLTLTPEMQRAFKQAQPMFKQPTAGSSAHAKATELANLPKRGETFLKGVESTAMDGFIDLSPEAVELGRVIDKAVGRSEGIRYGTTYTKAEAIDHIEGAKDLRQVLKDKGMSTKAIDKYIADFEKVAKENQGIVPVGIEASRKHETLHGADLKSRIINSETAKDLVVDGEIKKLKYPKLLQTFKREYAKFVGRSVESIPDTEAMTEAISYLGDGEGERFGLTEVQAAKVLADIGIARFNSLVEAYDGDVEKAKANMAAFNIEGGEKIYEAIKSTDDGKGVRPSTESGQKREGKSETTGSSDVGDAEKAGQGQATTEKSDGVKIKERKTVKTAHEYGLLNKSNTAGEIRYYTEKQTDPIERAAQDYVEQVGFQSAYAQAVLSPLAENDIVHLSRQMAVIQLLDQHAQSARNAGDLDLYDFYEAQSQAVMSALAPEATEAGRFIQYLSKWKITNPATVLARVKLTRVQNGLPSKLDADVEKKLVEAAEKIQKAQAIIEAYEARIDELENKEPHTVNGRKTKPLTKTEKKVVDRFAKAREQAIARLRGDAPMMMAIAYDPKNAQTPLAEDIQNDIIDIGASLILEGWHGKPITRPEFDTQMKALLNAARAKDFTKHADEIYAQSITRMDESIKAQKREDEIARVRGEVGNENKSVEEIEALIAQHKADQKSNNKIRAEHRKAAKKYNADNRYVQKVQELYPNITQEVMSGVLMRREGANSPASMTKALRAEYPAKFKHEQTDTPEQRREKLRALNHTIAESEKAYKATERAMSADRVATRDAKLTPEQRQELQEAKANRAEGQKQLTQLVREAEVPKAGLFRSIAQVSRAMKTALVQTAMTNIISTKVEQNIVNKPIDVMDIQFQRWFKGLESEGLTGDASIATAFWTPNAMGLERADKGLKSFMKGLSKHEIMLRVIDENPEYFAKFFGDISPDFHSGVSKTLDVLMIPMRVQEFFMRDSEAVKALAQRAAMKGLDFAEILEKGDYGAFNKADVEYALKRALDLTYASRPQHGKGVTASVFTTIASALRYNGAIDLIASEQAPFLNFMYNTINKYKTKIPVMAQTRLAMKTGITAKRMRRSGEEPHYIKEAIRQNWTSRQIADQIWGVIAFGILLGAVRMLGDADEWYLFRVPWTKGLGRDSGSLYFDIRTQPMLAPIAFLANKFNRLMNGKDMFTYDEGVGALAEPFLGMSYRANIEQNQMNQAALNLAYYALDDAKGGEDAEKNWDKAMFHLAKWGGNTVGTLTNFLQFKTMKDIAAQFDKDEQTQLRLNDRPFLQGIDMRLPESKRILRDILKLQVEEDRNYATGAKEPRNQYPIFKVLGFNFRDEADVLKEPSQAEILANKLAWEGKSYKRPILPDEVKIAEIKRDFRKAGEKLSPDSPEGKALLKTLEQYKDILPPGVLKAAGAKLFTTNLQDNFDRLSATDAIRVFRAAQGVEKDILTDPFRQKLLNVAGDKSKSPQEQQKARDALKKFDLNKPPSSGVDEMLNAPEMKKATTDDLVEIMKLEGYTAEEKAKVTQALLQKAGNALKSKTLTAEEIENIKTVLPDFNETEAQKAISSAKIASSNLSDDIKSTFDSLGISAPSVGDSLTPKKGGEKIKLTPEQQAKYERETIERIEAKVRSLQTTTAYKNAPENVRKKMIEGIIRKQRSEEQKETKSEMLKAPKLADLAYAKDGGSDFEPRPIEYPDSPDKWKGQRLSTNILDKRKGSKLDMFANLITGDIGEIRKAKFDGRGVERTEAKRLLNEQIAEARYGIKKGATNAKQVLGELLKLRARF